MRHDKMNKSMKKRFPSKLKKIELNKIKLKN